MSGKKTLPASAKDGLLLWSVVRGRGGVGRISPATEWHLAMPGLAGGCQAKQSGILARGAVQMNKRTEPGSARAGLHAREARRAKGTQAGRTRRLTLRQHIWNVGLKAWTHPDLPFVRQQGLLCGVVHQRVEEGVLGGGCV